MVGFKMPDSSTPEKPFSEDHELVGAVCDLLASYRVTGLCSVAVGKTGWGNSFLGASPSTQDFVNEVAVNHMLETELRKLAEERGGAKTKEFAAKILKEHRGISSQLKSLVRIGQVKVTLPATMDDGRRAKLNQLKGMSGIGFDEAFEDLQVSIHNDTVSLFERYGGEGSHPDLKLFAFKYLPSLIEQWNLALELGSAPR